MKTINALNKIFSLLMTKKMSVFDFFVQLDTNISTKISKLELKTGLFSLGLKIS